jgi:hypothetical protein
MVAFRPELEGGDQQMVPYSAIKGEKERFWNDNGNTTTDVSFGERILCFGQDANINGLMPKDKNRRTSVRINSAKHMVS